MVYFAVGFKVRQKVYIAVVFAVQGFRKQRVHLVVFNKGVDHTAAKKVFVVVAVFLGPSLNDFFGVFSFFKLPH